jgi:protein translocase SecG subunit
MNIFLGILLLLAALFLIVAVLLQNGKSKGTGVVTGGAETFFGKNKGKAIDKKLSMLIFSLEFYCLFFSEKSGLIHFVKYRIHIMD